MGFTSAAHFRVRWPEVGWEVCKHATHEACMKNPYIDLWLSIMQPKQIQLQDKLNAKKVNVHNCMKLELIKTEM